MSKKQLFPINSILHNPESSKTDMVNMVVILVLVFELQKLLLVT